MNRLAVVPAWSLAWFLVSTLPAQAPPPTVITGTVLDPEGHPLKLAHVHLERPSSGAPLARSLVEPDGRYAIATAATGAVFLRFTGVDHTNALVPMVLAPPATIVLDVRLRRYEYTGSLDSITAIGDWNQFNFGTGRRLARQPDGRYTLDVESTADTVAYQLVGLAGPGHSINGTDAVRYVYDEGGDYRSVLKVEHGHATIVFDPSRLDRRPSTRRITFRDPYSQVARLAEAYDTTRRWLRAYFDASDSARSRHDSLRFNWTPTVRDLGARLAGERDPLLKQLYLFTALEVSDLGGAIDTSVVRRATREIPPDSPWWSLRDVSQQPSQLVTAAAKLEHPGQGPRELFKDSTVVRRAVDFLDTLVARHPDPGVRADALATAVYFLKLLKDDVRANDYYERLLAEYPDAPMVAVLKARFAPDRVLRVGAEIPDFRLVALGDSSVAYTRASMLGKTYLLEFWATWCGPCIGEMPDLHAAYDSLARRGLQILSVSLDRAPEDVTKFRAGQWKMPWLHAFVPGMFDSPVMRQFEIVFIPRAALVGSDGHILATDEELRGDRLLGTLQRSLPAP